MINKIVKSNFNKKKYSRKYIERVIDYGYINDLYKLKYPDNFCTCETTTEICEIFETENMGKGVRSKFSLPKGTEIGCYLGNIVPEKSVRKDNYYVFYYMLRGWVIDGSTNNSITSYLNHSKNPNLSTFFTFHFVDGEPELHLSFKTNQDVEIGEELFIDYGEEFWKDNPIQEL